MPKSFKFDGFTYNLDDLSDKGREILNHLAFIHQKLHTLKNEQALLNRARNGYIEDIKTEVIEKKSGVDLSGLFVDD